MAQSGSKNKGTSGRRAAKAPTMASVGRLAGVSQVTVSRALSDPSKVSQETLSRINEAIRLTGFVPNAVAGALASQKSMLVSALVPSISNPIYASMIGPFSEMLRSKGYQILLSETGQDPEKEYATVQRHLSRRPDAMLLTGVQHSSETKRLLLSANIPVVEVWELTSSPIDVCVGFDHAAAGAAVADAALQYGYRHAIYLSALDRRAALRMSSFAYRFERLGGEVLAQKISETTNGIVTGRKLLSAILESQSLPEKTVVFCSSDAIAHGAMIEAKARSLRVPENLAIVGFGDQDFAAHLEPALASVRVDRDILGRSAAEALVARLNGAPMQTNAINIGFEFIPRASFTDKVTEGGDGS